MQDAYLLESLRSDLFDVWVCFQRERETPGKRGREGLPGTTTSVSRAERRSQMITGLFLWQEEQVAAEGVQ